MSKAKYARMTISLSPKNFKRSLAVILAAGLTIGAAAAANTPANAAQAFKFSIAMIGDMPYDAKGQQNLFLSFALYFSCSPAKFFI